MAYRAIGQLPLVVLVGLDEENELAEADSVAAWVRLSTIATLLLAAALLAMMALRAARQRSHMELELTRQEADAAEMARTHIARLLSGLPAAVYGATLTAQGGVDRFEITETAQRLTGWDLSELTVRAGWTAKVQGLDADAWTAYFRKVLQEGEASIEYNFLRRDGASVWFRDQARVVERRGPDEIAVVGYVSDITRERSMQEQAFAASKLATLGEMATGLAHELNQPSDDTLSAKGPDQTLTGGLGHDALEGFAGGGTCFRDSAAGLDGDVIRGLEAGGSIVVTDLLAGAVLEYAGGETGGVLAVSDGLREAHITLEGRYQGSGFRLSGDGPGGVQIGYLRL